MSGGDIEQTGRGAAFGAIFSLGFDVAGYARTKIDFPAIKYGSSKVPFEGIIEGEVYSGEATWKGLYYQRGANAKPLFGTWENMPSEGVRVSPISGETQAIDRNHL